MLIHYATRFLHETDEQAEYLAQYSPTRAALFIDSISIASFASWSYSNLTPSWAA